MRKYLYILLIFIGFVAFSSCKEETFTTIFNTPEMNEEVEEGYANLEILMNTSDLNVSSRAVGPLESPVDNSTWTNWEKFCDGSLLYRVTLFLVKNGNENGIDDGTLVAYRDFYYGSGDINEHNGFYVDNAVNTDAATGVKVKATFSSKDDELLHGDIEKLQIGDYRLIAVANYAPIADDNTALFAESETVKTYDGLGSVAEDGGDNNGVGGDFTNIVSTVIDNFNENTGLSGFTIEEGSYGASLLNYKLNSGDDRVCKLLPQPLVMVRDIKLKNGNNTLSGELYRTFARIRLDVTNADVEYPIGISKLSFTGTYASQTAYLFNDRLGNGLYNCFATNDMGTLTVTSTDAIFPFMDRTNQILAGKSLTLLDCYILEGKTGEKGDNAFSFITTYWTDPWSGSATENISITDWNTFLSYKVFIRESTSSTYNILKADETSGTIVIRNAGAGAQDKAATTLNPLFLWYIIPRGDLQINSNELGFAEGYLMNVGTGKYLQAHDGSTTDFSLKLGEYPSTLYFKINFKGMDEYGTIFCQSKDGNYYYINSKSSVWSEYGTSAPSLNSGNYSFLTFETIPGEPVGAVPKDQGSTIDISNNTSLEIEEIENVIVRNDFFHYKFNCKVTDATEVSVKPVEHTCRIKLNDFSSNSDPYISVSGITTTTNGTSSYVDGIEYFYFDYYIDTDGYLVVTIKYLLESSDSKLPDNATINFGTVRSGGGDPNGGNVTENITHSILISNFINTMTDIVLEKAT